MTTGHIRPASLYVSYQYRARKPLHTLITGAITCALFVAKPPALAAALGCLSESSPAVLTQFLPPLSDGQ